jgi:CDP-paratose 2-epimerase
MKWLITGGCGFIGSNLAGFLMAKGGTPIVVDNLSRPRVEENRNWLLNEFGIKTFEIDILDLDKLNLIFETEKNIDGIIHLAGQVSLLSSINNPRRDFEINALGTLNVLECFKNHAKDAHLVFTSSNKVYGELSSLNLDENKTRYSLIDYPNGINEEFIINPTGGYGSSKYSAELLIADWSRNYSLKSTVLRQSSVYGERQFPTSDQGWAAFFTEQFIAGINFEISGNGKQVRDLLYVKDLCDLIYTIIERGSDATGTYNVGGGQENSLSLLELFKELSLRTRNFPEFLQGSMRPFDQKVFISDNSKISFKTGWEPKTTINKGLTKLVQWIESN